MTGIATLLEESCGVERESRRIPMTGVGDVNRVAISSTCFKRSTETAGTERKGCVGSAPTHPSQKATLHREVKESHISMNLQAMPKHIELWLLDKLIPYARNPRTHSDAQVAQIAASIAEFGFNNPILVDSADGIIAGHGRLLA